MFKPDLFLKDWIVFNMFWIFNLQVKFNEKITSVSPTTGASW